MEILGSESQKNVMTETTTTEMAALLSLALLSTITSALTQTMPTIQSQLHAGRTAEMGFET